MTRASWLRGRRAVVLDDLAFGQAAVVDGNLIDLPSEACLGVAATAEEEPIRASRKGCQPALDLAAAIEVDLGGVARPDEDHVMPGPKVDLGRARKRGVRAVAGRE